MKPRPRFKNLLLVAALVMTIGGVAYWCTTDQNEVVAVATPTTPDAALQELRSGNLRFVNSHRTHSTDTAHDAEYRRQTAKGQHPFATILACSDSRVCPEFIFDQRAGSIFEVRNAGNVVDEDVLASLEYAVAHLHVPLIVVLGHKGCGAVGAVCEAGDRPLHDHLRDMQAHMSGIRRQVLDAHGRHDPEVVNRLAAENARQQALAVLRDSPALSAAVQRGEVRLVYGLYDMETGVVDFLGPEVRPAPAEKPPAEAHGRLMPTKLPSFSRASVHRNEPSSGLS
jgi:carbonic anhydrase